MAEQSQLARLGLRAGVLGNNASLALAAPLATGDYSNDAHTDASRIGWWFDRTVGDEAIVHTVNGSDRLRVGVSIEAFAPILAQDGGTPSPSISFTSDPTTGFYKTTLGVVSFAFNGVDGGSVGHDSPTSTALVLVSPLTSGSVTLSVDDVAGTGATLSTVSGHSLSVTATNAGATISGTGVQFVSSASAVLFPASNVTRASMNLPHGTAPAAPVNGDIWTTTTGVFAQINGVTVGPFGAGGGTITGGGAAGQVSYFTGASAIAGDTGLTYDAGTDTLSIGTALRNGSGTAANPSYTFTADTNTGLYNAAADTIGFTANGIAAVTLNVAGTVSTLTQLSPDGGTTLITTVDDDAASVGVIITSNGYLTIASGTNDLDITSDNPISLYHTGAGGAASITVNQTTVSDSYGIEAVTSTSFWCLTALALGEVNTFSGTFAGSANNTLFNYTGSGTSNLDLPPALMFTGPTGFSLFIAARNSGSGTLVLNRVGSDTIDGATSLSIQPGESVILFSNNVDRWIVYSRTQTGSTSISGSGGTGQVAYWTSASTLASEAAFAYNSATNTLTAGDVVQVGAGAAATPSYSFTGDPNTGLYSVGADQFGISTGGALRLTVANAVITPAVLLTTVASASGSAGFRLPVGVAPSAPVDGDVWNETNGIFARLNSATFKALVTVPGNVGTGRIPFTVNATTGQMDMESLLTYATGGNLSTVRFLAGDGTAAAPSFTFTSDTDTGVYLSAANTLAFSAGNGLRESISSTAITATVPYQAGSGSAGTPSYSFSGDPNTGIYNQTTDTISISCGGNLLAYFDSLGLTVVSAGIDAQGGDIIGARLLAGSAGSANNPRFALNDGILSTGIYFPSSSSLGISTTGTLRLTIADAVITPTVLITTVASATGGAGFRLPHGAAPSAPVNGDVWTTTAGMFAYINGATVGPFGAGGGISGSGSANQIVYWTGASTVSGEAAFTYNPATNALALTGTGVVTTTAGIGLQVNSSSDTSLDYAVDVQKYMLTPTASGVYRSVNAFLNDLGSANLDRQVQGLFFEVAHFGTGNNTGNLRSIGGISRLASNATVSEVSGIVLQVGTNNGGADTTGTIGELNGLYIIPLKTASSTITTSYGVRIADMVGTTQYAIYTGAGLVRFGGQVLASAGAAATPSYSFSGDPDTGFYSGIAEISFAIDGNAAGGIYQAAGDSGLYLAEAGGDSVTLSANATESYLQSTNTFRLFNVAGDLFIDAAASLNISAVTSVTSNAVILGTSGSASAPAFSFTGDPDTGMYSAGANQLGFSTNTAVRLTIIDASSTFTNKVITQAAASGGAFFNLPHGASPAAPVNGDVWTTTTSLFARINGASVSFVGGTGGSTRIAYWNSATTITGETDLTYNDTTNVLTAGGGYVATTGSFTGPLNSATTATFTFSGDTNTGMYSPGADQIGFTTAGTLRYSIANTVATVSVAELIQPAAQSNPSIKYALTVTGAANTNLGTGAEATDIDFNLARTVNFTAGAITTQRAFRIRNPTYTFTSGSTITTAATVYIDGAPVAGSNATITNSYALYVAGSTALTRIEGYLVLTGANTPGTPALTFDGDTNTGIYRPGSDQIGFAAGGSLVMSITTTSVNTASGITFNCGSTVTGESFVWTIAGTATSPALTRQSDNDTGIYFSAADNLSISSGGIESARFEDPADLAASETSLWIYDFDNGQMEQVTVGAADSGGVGFKLLRIPN